MLYLLLGQDSLSKDKKLKELKKEFLSAQTEQFNLDTLYSKELALKTLQEKLLYLPLNSQKRIVVIKGAEDLKEECRGFILEYIKRPSKEIVIVLDINRHSSNDKFVNSLQRHAKVFKFAEFIPPNTFTLARYITSKKADYALKTLNQLIDNGERPERILGGLRYTLERDAVSLSAMKSRLKLLLNCDIEIKTGRLKANFALEKLIICLCSLGKAFG